MAFPTEVILPMQRDPSVPIGLPSAITGLPVKLLPDAPSSAAFATARVLSLIPSFGMATTANPVLLSFFLIAAWYSSPSAKATFKESASLMLLTFARISNSLPLSATTTPATAPLLSYSLSSHPTSDVTPTTVTTEFRTSLAISSTPFKMER